MLCRLQFFASVPGWQRDFGSEFVGRFILSFAPLRVCQIRIATSVRFVFSVRDHGRFPRRGITRRWSQPLWTQHSFACQQLRGGSAWFVRRTSVNLPSTLVRCGFRPFGTPESMASVAKTEELIGVPLPSDYRDFMLSFGGGYLHSWAPCTIPTPFGEHGMSKLHNFQEVWDLLESDVTPRNMICIGYGDFGATTCLSVAGLDHGRVFSLDTEMRFFWDQARLSRYPNLDPEIREWFKMRDSEQLPPRPWGYENCYHVADSFSEFIAKLHPSEGA